MKKTLLIALITIMTLTLTGCGNEDNNGLDTNISNMAKAGDYMARNNALKDIPNDALVIDELKASELTCEAIGVAETTIVVVKCSTTNDNLIKYYGSDTIYYAYQENADGSKYWHYASKDQSEAIEKVK